MSLKELRNFQPDLESKTFNPFIQIGDSGAAIVNEQFETIRTNFRYYQSPVVCKVEHVPNCLNILHINARSILSDLKFEEFQLFINSSKEI